MKVKLAASFTFMPSGSVAGFHVVRQPEPEA
jgi:hypothetical protein